MIQEYLTLPGEERKLVEKRQKAILKKQKEIEALEQANVDSFVSRGFVGMCKCDGGVALPHNVSMVVEQYYVNEAYNEHYAFDCVVFRCVCGDSWKSRVEPSYSDRNFFKSYAEKCI